MKKNFTLVELMVVLIIVGIATAIAMPSYMNAIERAKNKEAIDTLNKAGDDMKMLELKYNSYIMGGYLDGNVTNYLNDIFGVPSTSTSTTCYNMAGNLWTSKHWEVGDWCYWVTAPGVNPNDYSLGAERRYVRIPNPEYRAMTINGTGVWNCDMPGSIGCQ